MTVTDAKLDANSDTWWQMTPAMRADACEWVRVHGFDDTRVVAVELDVLDCPMLRAFCTTEDLEVDADGELVLLAVERAIRASPPDWWQPNG